MMSGLHTSISTHIASNFEQANGTMAKNLTYFNERVGWHEDRIRNFYLIYAAVLKAAKLMEPAFQNQKYTPDS